MDFVRQISDHVIRIQGRNAGAFPYCNTYMVRRDGALVVIDPQCGLDRLDAGLAYFRCLPQDITAIILTHFHVDHSAPCRRLSQRLKVPVYMHALDAPAVASWESMYARYGIRTDSMQVLLRETFGGIAGFSPFRVDVRYTAGDRLPGGLHVIHSPGHTPGHCCLLCEGLLFSGDVELNVPWVGNVSSSVSDFLNTTEMLSALPIHTILPGHGQVCTAGCSKALLRYREKLLINAESIYGVLTDRPQSVAVITRAVSRCLSGSVRNQFKDGGDLLLFHFEKIASGHYLNYLKDGGRAVRMPANNGEALWRRP